MAEVITATGAIPFPYDPVRTAIVLMYNEPGMIADRVLPRTPPLGKKEFRWFRYKIGDSFVIPDTTLGRKSTPNTVEFEGEHVDDSTEHHGLRDVVPQEDVDAAAAAPTSTGEPIDPVNTAAIQLTHLMKLDREVRTANLVFSESSYTTDYKETLAQGQQFSNTTGDPLGVMDDALDTPLYRPNVIVFGQQSWRAFRKHPKVLKATNRESGSDSGLASRRAVAELFEVDEILVGRSRVASSKEGQPLQLRRAWGKSVALIYRGAYSEGSRTPGGMAGSEMQEGLTDLRSELDRATFGFTAVYKDLNAASRFNQGMGISGVTELLVRDSIKEVICGGNAFGYLISGAVA